MQYSERLFHAMQILIHSFTNIAWVLPTVIYMYADGVIYMYAHTMLMEEPQFTEPL